MELFKKGTLFQKMKSLGQSLLGEGNQKLREDYDAFMQEHADLQDALASESCARKDTEERCKALYGDLQEEKKKNGELRSKVSVLEASLSDAEGRIASIGGLAAKNEATIRRLAKLCFGKKSEKLMRLLGKKGYADLKAILCPDAGSSTDGSTERAAQLGGGTPHGKNDEVEENLDAGSGSPRVSATHAGNPVDGQAEGPDTPPTPGSQDPEAGSCNGGCPSQAGQGSPEGDGKGHAERSGKRGKKGLKRKAGYLDRYCDPKNGVVYTFDNINYNREDILNFFAGSGGSTAGACISSDIEVYKTLEYHPGFYYYKYHISPTIRKGDCTLRGLRTDRILNASAASPSVLAHLAFMKFRQGLPYNALCGLAAAEGGNIQRGTAAGWLNTGYEGLLMPVHMALLQFAKKYADTLIGDETYAYWRSEGGTGTGYFWGIRTSPLGTDGGQVVFYAFDDTRQSAVPLFYLHGYAGNFLTDGYVAYEAFETKDGGVVRCCCWVHGRRALVEALPGGGLLEDLTEESKARLWAWTALCIISEMFHLEREWRHLSPEARLERRKDGLSPLVDRFFEEARRALESPAFDSASEEGKALNYFLGRERALRRLLEDGSIPLSTNDIERCNIVVALTRKRAKVFDTSRGATAAGGYFSLICTAEANGTDPEKYLRYLYTIMPSMVYEHRTEIDHYREYMEEAGRRLRAVKEARKKNPKAPAEIKWDGLEEPDLSFLMPAMPWSAEYAAFLEADDELVGRKELLDAMTRKNIEESTLSQEAMRRILSTDKNLADERLDGLREILASLPTDGCGMDGDRDPARDIVKGMEVYDSYYPKRFFEILQMRERKGCPGATGGRRGGTPVPDASTGPPGRTAAGGKAPCGGGRFCQQAS